MTLTGLIEAGTTTVHAKLVATSTNTVQATYKITTGYKPTYKDKTSYPNGTLINFSDFTVVRATDSNSYKDWINPFTYDTYYDRKTW